MLRALLDVLAPDAVEPGGQESEICLDGVFIRPLGSVIYLTPAFTISEGELHPSTTANVKVVRQSNGGPPGS